MGILRGAVELLKDVSGANLPDCIGKTKPGVRCKKKAKPGFGGSCGNPKCTTVFGEAVQ